MWKKSVAYSYTLPKVIGKKEQLTGFSAGGGIETKKFLLQLEVPNVYNNIFN